MADYPPEILTAAADALHHDRICDEDPWTSDARIALDIAAPLLAEAVAQAILRHSDEHEPKPGSSAYLAWHRYFGIAARIAAGAFTTEAESKQMAACAWCEEPMDGRPCIGKPLAETAVVEGVSYYRIPWGPPPDLHDDREFLGGTDPEQLASIRERWATWPEGFAANCRDCATPQGALHHPGCDTERCPRCLGQAISCGCKWEGNTADPDDDGFRDPESPYARRAP